MGHGEKADAWDMMAVTTPLPSSWESHADVVVLFFGGERLGLNNWEVSFLVYIIVEFEKTLHLRW